MGGRSAAASRTPSSAIPCGSGRTTRTPERARAREPRTHRAQPTHFSRVQTRHSGSLAGFSRQQRGRELTQRRSFSSHSSEPVQPPGSNAGRERKKKAAEGRARPKSWRGSAHISPGTPTSRSHWSVMTPAPQSHAPAGSRPCPGREPSV